MHTIHTTEAFILSSRPVGEGSVWLSLYTRDFGCLGARAQGAREHASKLRYHLQEGGHILIDLVRGRDVWRVVGATPDPSSPSAVRARDARSAHARIFRLLERLHPGEDADDALFETVRHWHIYAGNSERTQAEVEISEIVCVARIVARLGYLDIDHLLRAGVSEHDYVFDSPSLRAQRHTILAHVNNALIATGL